MSVILSEASIAKLGLNRLFFIDQLQQICTTNKEMGFFSKGNVQMDVILDRRVFAPGNMSPFHMCLRHRWGMLHNYVVKQQTCSLSADPSPVNSFFCGA